MPPASVSGTRIDMGPGAGLNFRVSQPEGPGSGRIGLTKPAARGHAANVVSGTRIDMGPEASQQRRVALRGLIGGNGGW
jgi:hypothetical protein